MGGRTWLEKVDLSLLGKICLVPCSFLSSFGFLDAIRGAASATTVHCLRLKQWIQMTSA